MLLLVLCASLLLLTFKVSFFLILVLFEVRLILAAYRLLAYGLSAWFILPLIGIGARESATGLSLSVWISRSVNVNHFAI